MGHLHRISVMLLLHDKAAFAFALSKDFFLKLRMSSKYCLLMSSCVCRFMERCGAAQFLHNFHKIRAKFSVCSNLHEFSLFVIFG